jgi:putative sterol carrier protein
MTKRARPPDDITPEQFFTKWVPEAVASDPERRARLGDTQAEIEFELTGDPGGSYCVRIDRGVVTGSAGPAPRPDVRLRLDAETWRALNRGDLSAPEALLRRRLHMQGSFLLALKLHLILG